MPLYHINIQIGNRRDVIVVDDMRDEFDAGIHDCFSLWMVSDKRIQGDGDTFEEALNNLFDRIDYKREIWKISDSMAAIRGTATWSNQPTVVQIA